MKVILIINIWLFLLTEYLIINLKYLILRKHILFENMLMSFQLVFQQIKYKLNNNNNKKEQDKFCSCLSFKREAQSNFNFLKA